MNRDRKARRDALQRRIEAKGPDTRSLTRRGLFLLGTQLAVGVALAYRMRQLQIVEAEQFRLLAEENRVNILLIPPVRAEIFDRAGVPLAVNRQNYRVVMTREQAGDVEATLDRLGLIIDIPQRRRRRVLKEMKKKSAFVPIVVADFLDWPAFAAVNANLPTLSGVQPEVALSRYYSNGELTAHIIGYVGRVTERELKAQETPDPVLQLPDFQIGKTGIESAIEHELRGQAGTKRIEVNAVGRVMREIDRIEGVPGTDLHLTLDIELQVYTRERLGNESAAVVAMDVNNGDLLALVSNPTYDPNLFVRGISSKNWNILLNDEYRPLANKWASGMYPPGSTFKMMVALAAMEAGVIGTAERVFCNGSYKLGNRRFHCWKRGGHGHMNMRQAIEQSCDVFFYEASRRAGVENIAVMARRFGLGGTAGLPIPAIRGGLIPDPEWLRAKHDLKWQKGDTLNIGIGQGYVLATPMQLAVMAARIATGNAVEPRLIRARGGVPVPIEPPPDLGIPTANLAMIRQGMSDVVNGKRGTARRSRIADTSNAMAGKTGTSQVYSISKVERARGVTKTADLPWNRRDHALFICFAPVDAPRIAVTVVVEHGGGSRVAAPIARDVMMRALYGSKVPLSAYPPGQRPKIEPPQPQSRPTAPDPTIPKIRT